MAMKKLQAEIDRVLKKVSEGVETFDGIYDKIQSTTNTNLKEKYEQDLKKEIKKLQRLRDQIKSWLASSDIKDKSSLLENRKLIESEMERFKTVEREMKTKAFSREGLLQREKMDPKEKEKADACDWISSTVDELSRQIEMAEAEVETMQGTTKRGKKDHAKAERIAEREHWIERDRWHIGRLELMLRLLENDQIVTEKVMEIQDDVQYYLECNQEPDFEEDEYIYDDLNLEEEEELYNVGIELNTPSTEEESIQVKEEELIQPVKTTPKISHSDSNSFKIYVEDNSDDDFQPVVTAKKRKSRENIPQSGSQKRLKGKGKATDSEVTATSSTGISTTDEPTVFNKITLEDNDLEYSGDDFDAPAIKRSFLGESTKFASRIAKSTSAAVESSTTASKTISCNFCQGK
ncbi:hypothetical protein G6F48_010267 [Rhizopus delemar]|nr:hypothetical protein G6F48_010267 [Rhizopus delemar]